MSECKYPGEQEKCPKYDPVNPGNPEIMEIISDLDLRCMWWRDSYGGIKEFCYAPWGIKETEK